MMNQDKKHLKTDKAKAKPIALGTTHLLASDVLELLHIWQDSSTSQSTLDDAADQLLCKLSRYHAGFRRDHYEQHITSQINMSVSVAIELLANYSIVSGKRTESEVTQIIGEIGKQSLYQRCTHVVRWFLDQSPLSQMSQQYEDLFHTLLTYCKTMSVDNCISTLQNLLSGLQQFRCRLYNAEQNPIEAGSTLDQSQLLCADSLCNFVAGTIRRVSGELGADTAMDIKTIPDERQLLQQIRDIMVS